MEISSSRQSGERDLYPTPCTLAGIEFQHLSSPNTGCPGFPSRTSLCFELSIHVSSLAEQGARANDHGCHDPCSEQHGSRQPRSWLILNVRQKTHALPYSACMF